MSPPQLYLKSHLLLAQDSSVLVVASIFHCKSETMKDKLKFMRVTAKRLAIFRSHVYLCKLTKAKVFCVFDAKDGVVTYLSKFLPQSNIVCEPPAILFSIGYLSMMMRSAKSKNWSLNHLSSVTWMSTKKSRLSATSLTLGWTLHVPTQGGRPVA